MNAFALMVLAFASVMAMTVAQNCDPAPCTSITEPDFQELENSQLCSELLTYLDDYGDCLNSNGCGGAELQSGLEAVCEIYKGLLTGIDPDASCASTDCTQLGTGAGSMVAPSLLAVVGLLAARN